ncbi:ubiquitin carboxyl-terminal hydrolase L5, partial [Reticulomyxa filosa]
MEEETFRRFRFVFFFFLKKKKINDNKKTLGAEVYGLIFLFKWDKELHKSTSENVLEDIPEGLFFARQMVTNACATQAILSVLLNCEDRVELGDTLTEFRNFSTDLDPDSIGIALENSAPIRTAHNSFARPEPIQIEVTESTKGEDAFHFVSYVPKNGILYEVEIKIKRKSIIVQKIGECEDKAWWEVARPELEKRMSEYGDELRFTLLAVVQDLHTVYCFSFITTCNAYVWDIKQKVYSKELATLAGQESEAAQQQTAELKALIETQDEKREKWR